MSAGWTTELANGLDGVMTQPREMAEPWDSLFERFYLEHYGRVVSVLFRLAPGRTEAEEMANEVFWKLYRQRLLPDPGGNVAGWLYRTATNLGIDVLRKNARRRDREREAALLAAQSRAAGTDRTGLGPLDGLLLDEKRRAVRQVLARLKPVQAQALVLRASGFSYHEVASALGVKRVSVGTLILRAEQAFRKHYRPAEGEEEI